MTIPPGGHSRSARSSPARRRGPAAMLGAAAGVCLLLTASVPAGTDQASDDFEVARGYYAKSRWDDAAGAFRKFVEDHTESPRVPYARLYLGISLENLEKYDEARRVLRRFVKDYPRNSNLHDAMFRVAECSYFLDDLKTAEAEFAAFLKASPKHEYAEWALPYLADTQYRLDKPRLAAATFRESLDRFPDGRMVEASKFGLARCHEALKEHEKAAALYKELAARQNSERAPEAQLNLATLYFDAGQYAEAARAYRELEKRFADSPLVPKARLNAGFAYYRLGDYKEAISQFDAAAKDASQQTTAEYWKGISHKSLGQYEQAIAALKAAFERDAKGPLAGECLYQRAGCERLAGDYRTARALYLDYVERWPRGEAADDSLHFAAESALLERKLDDAQQLIDRFGGEYPDSDLWPFQAILQGRVLDARGGPENLKAAVARFQSVIEKSRNPRTQSLARFEMARALRKLDDHARAVEVLAPVVAQVEKEGEASEFVDALVVAGNGELELKQYDRAAASMSLYLKLRPQGDQADQALATRATAYAHSGRNEQAQADLDRLASKHANSPLVGPTIHSLAELAYGRKAWDWSAKLFGMLAALGSESPFHGPGLSGLAWSRFEQGQYREAAVAFARLLKEYPTDTLLAPQAAYKYAESLEKAGETADAAAAYTAAFEKYAPSEPAAAGSEQKGGPHYYTFYAGLNAARTLAKLKMVAEADAAYEALFKIFPQPADLDRRLDEWAVLNHNAGNFKRADEIFRRLVEAAPDSSLADNARYTLAESELNAGKLDAAKKVFEELLASPRSDRLVKEASLYRLVGVAVEQGDWKAVGARAGEFLLQFPASDHRWYAAFHQAEAQLRMNDLDSARDVLVELKAEKDDSPAARSDWFPRVWVLLAEIQSREKKYDDVEAAVAEMRARFPKSPLLYQADDILGRSYKNQAKFDLARAAFQRVVEDPAGRRTETAAKCQLLIAETYLMQEEHKSAQQEYFKVYLLYKFPEWQAPALFMAAQCDEALEQWDKAAKAYRDLLAEFPESEYAAKAKARLEIARKKAGS